MADIRDLKLLDLEDAKVIKQYIDNKAGASATSALHTVSLDSTAHQIKFYTQESTAVQSTTPAAFTVDIKDIYDEVGKMSTVTINGVATTVVADALSALDTEIGSLTGLTVNGASATSVIDAIKALDTKLDGATTIAVKEADGTATTSAIKAINRLNTEVGDAKVTVLTGASTTASDITAAINQLDKEMGDDALEVVMADSTTAGDVKKAINRLNVKLGEETTASKLIITETVGTTADNFLKKYEFAQGTTANKIGTINLAKDLVVEKGSVVTVKNGVDSEGESTTEADGTYLKLVIANQAARVYINTKDLVEDFTVEANATEVQLKIDTTSGRELQAKLVADGVTTTAIKDGSIVAGKLSTASVTSEKIATGAVTSAAMATSAIVSTVTVPATTADHATITASALDGGIIDALNLAYASLQTTSINCASTSEVAAIFA